MSKKVTVEDLGLKFDGMPEAQAAFLRKCAEMVVNVVNKSNEGQLTDEQFMEKMNTALKPFAGIDNESIQSLIKENSELRDAHQEPRREDRETGRERNQYRFRFQVRRVVQ